MALATGQTYTLSGKVQTGQAPGQSKWTLDPGQQVKILNSRTVGGQLYYDVQHIGGGTGWTAASQLEGSVGGGGGSQQTSLPSFQPAEIQRPKSSEQLQPFLDSYQKQLEDLKKQQGQILTDEQIKAEIKEYVTPATPRPEVPKLVDLFNEMRTDADISGLETNLNSLKAAEDDILNRQRLRKQEAIDKPTALGVIGGRISEIDRQENDALEFVQRQKARVVDELQTRYTLINTIINLTGQDYNNAVTAYNTEFNQNLAIYDAFTKQRSEREQRIERLVTRAEDKVLDIKSKMIEFEREDFYKAQDAARSNLQIYANMITSGSLNYSALSPEAKASISKLEVQSGLGVGFVSSLGLEGGGIKSITTREAGGTKYADVIYQNPDGSIRVESKAIGAAGSGSGSTEKVGVETVDRALDLLYEQDSNGDGLLSRQEANNALSRIRGLTTSEAAANEAFSRAWSVGGFKKWQPEQKKTNSSSSNKSGGFGNPTGRTNYYG